MNIQVTSDNIEVTPSMQELASQKVSKIDAHASGISEDEKFYRVVLNKAQGTDNFEVKLEADLGGKVYFSYEANSVLETAIIGAVEEVDRQYLKDKEQNTEKVSEENRQAKRFDENLQEED